MWLYLGYQEKNSTVQNLLEKLKMDQMEENELELESKKKTIQKRDVEQSIDSVDALAFLEGVLDSWWRQLF